MSCASSRSPSSPKQKPMLLKQTASELSWASLKPTFSLPSSQKLFNANQSRTKANTSWFPPDFPAASRTVKLTMWVHGIWLQTNFWSRIAVICFAKHAKGHSSEYSLRLLQRKHDWTTATCSLQLPRDLNPDWSLRVSWWTSVDIKSETIGVISWKLLWSQVVLRFGWWFSLVARTLLGLDINGQQSTKSTKFNLFKLVLTYLWKVHLRFAFVTPTQCLFPGYVGSCHALMVSEQVPLQDGNCQTCMSASLSQWGSFQLCAASEPRRRRWRKYKGRWCQQSRVDRDPLSLQRIPPYWLHRRTP